MKFFAVPLLAIFAISYVRGDSEACSEESTQVCVDSLLTAIAGGSVEEVCRELRNSIDCLREATNDCLDEPDDELEEGLEELEKIYRETCNANSNNDIYGEIEEIRKCFNENKDYIMSDECFYEGTQQVLAVLTENEKRDEDTLKCAMYGVMANCFVDRIREKCGEKAGDLAEKEMSDVPQEIVDACNAAGGMETLFNLLEDKRRK